MTDKAVAKKATHSAYLEWEQTVRDRVAVNGEGIVIRGRELGELVKRRMGSDKGSLLDQKVKMSPSVGQKKSSELKRAHELAMMEAYSRTRAKHNASYYQTYGHPAPRRLTNAVFDSKHGAGASQLAQDIAKAYYRREHQVRREILSQAIAEKSRIYVNGIKFHIENGRWVTNETSAPYSLLSKSAGLAMGIRPKIDKGKVTLYPGDAEGLLKLGKETSLDFLTLVVLKMKQREEVMSRAGALGKSGLKRAQITAEPKSVGRSAKEKSNTRATFATGLVSSDGAETV